MPGLPAVRAWSACHAVRARKKILATSVMSQPPFSRAPPYGFDAAQEQRPHIWACGHLGNRIRLGGSADAEL